ncbi:MAG: hypothetical protein AAB225_31545 [Acidobacteriota bacterium]
MGPQIAHEIRTAIRHLNPRQVRASAERPLSIGLAALSEASLAAMAEFFAPRGLSRQRRQELAKVVHRVGEPGGPRRFDLTICEQGLPYPDGAFVFDPREPQRTVAEIIEAREDLGLALARHFLPFRKPVANGIIQSVSRENAAFTLLTALPNIVPGLGQFPWAIGEFASDTAFLTMNQVRMAFLLAAASDRVVGYREQRMEIASIVAGAFGWRALARELVAKIPFGAGVIPKAAVAYAGTYTVGQGLERFYRLGYRLSREERRRVYGEALEGGRRFVDALLAGSKIRGATRP